MLQNSKVRLLVPSSTTVNNVITSCTLIYCTVQKSMKDESDKTQMLLSQITCNINNLLTFAKYHSAYKLHHVD
jgi:hypothetical protein